MSFFVAKWKLPVCKTKSNKSNNIYLFSSNLIILHFGKNGNGMGNESHDESIGATIFFVVMHLVLFALASCAFRGMY